MKLSAAGYVLAKTLPAGRVELHSHPLPTGKPLPEGFSCFLYGSKRILPTLRRIYLQALEDNLEFFRVDLVMECESRTSKISKEDLPHVEFLFSDLLRADLRNLVIDILSADEGFPPDSEIGDFIAANPERLLRIFQHPRFCHLKAFAVKVTANDSDSRQPFDQVVFIRDISSVVEDVCVRGVDPETIDLVFV